MRSGCTTSNRAPTVPPGSIISQATSISPSTVTSISWPLRSTQGCITMPLSWNTGRLRFHATAYLLVLETLPAGMVLGTELPQYTTGDLAGIERLYGFVPSGITVDSNPTGLQLVVDNVTCTAPCKFSNWTLGSTHTLAVSQAIQTLGTAPAAQSYLFGRWNSDVNNTQSATVTVTNSGGNGSLLSPATSPAITNYLASFIQGIRIIRRSVRK